MFIVQNDICMLNDVTEFLVFQRGPMEAEIVFQTLSWSTRFDLMRTNIFPLQQQRNLKQRFMSLLRRFKVSESSDEESSLTPDEFAHPSHDQQGALKMEELLEVKWQSPVFHNLFFPWTFFFISVAETGSILFCIAIFFYKNHTAMSHQARNLCLFILYFPVVMFQSLTEIPYATCNVGLSKEPGFPSYSGRPA